MVVLSVPLHHKYCLYCTDVSGFICYHSCSTVLIYIQQSVDNMSFFFYCATSLVESWPSNNILPLWRSWTLGLFCPFYEFHLFQVIPDINFPSGLRPSYWSSCEWFPFVYFLYSTSFSHSIYVPKPTQSLSFNIIYYVPVFYWLIQFYVCFDSPVTIIFTVTSMWTPLSLVPDDWVQKLKTMTWCEKRSWQLQTVSLATKNMLSSEDKN